MVQVPKFDVLTTPTDSPVLNLKNSTLFIASIVTDLIGSLITLNKFPEISFEYKIIIILSITCIILFVDIIILYVKDRENHFKNTYVINVYQNLCNQINSLQNETSKLDNETSKLHNEINHLKTEHKNLKN